MMELDTIVCGDYLQVMAEMLDGCIDAIITDPPYGTGKYETDIQIDAKCFADWKRRVRTLAIFGFPELLVKWCVIAQIIPDEWITWWPTNKMGSNTSKLPKESEAIAIFGFCPGTRRLFRPRAKNAWGRLRAAQRGLNPELARLGDVWRDASPGMACNHHLRLHPNQKPESLMENLITLCTNEGETVFDPFMGSGTTAVTALKLGRHFYGCDINPDYVRLANERVEKARLEMLQTEMHFDVG